MKDIKNIEALLERYFEGETSLEEEALLKKYFTGADVDARLKQYVPLFQFFTHDKEVKLEKEITVKPQPKLAVLRGGNWWRMAAAVAIMVAGCLFIYKQFEKQPTKQTAHHARVIILDEGDDPQKALEEVNKALMKVSKKMRKGQEQTEEGLLKVRKATDKLNFE